MGASEDATRIYFASTEDLTCRRRRTGQPRRGPAGPRQAQPLPLRSGGRGRELRVPRHAERRGRRTPPRANSALAARPTTETALLPRQPRRRATPPSPARRRSRTGYENLDSASGRTRHRGLPLRRRGGRGSGAASVRLVQPLRGAAGGGRGPSRPTKTTSGPPPRSPSGRTSCSPPAPWPPTAAACSSSPTTLWSPPTPTAPRTSMSGRRRGRGRPWAAAANPPPHTAPPTAAACR